MSMALTISFVGVMVVFLGLGGLSLLIYLNAKHSKKRSKKNLQADVTEDEVAVISLAIYLTKLFNETQASEFRVKHKASSAWFMKSLLGKRQRR